MKKTLIIALAACLGTAGASANVVLPAFFTDSMVVQHDAILTIPGKAKKKSTVKITPSWGDPIKVKTDKNGRFEAKVPTPGTGGPYTITFDDGTGSLTLNDVLSGAVWFCSGQSNMEMPIGGWGKVMDYRKEIAEANYPEVRLLQVTKQCSYSPDTEAAVNMGGWRSAQPETVENFSSIGYFFGREFYDNLGIPVGIIDCTWGGTPIESWMSYESLKDEGEFLPELKFIEDNNFDATSAAEKYARDIDEWNKKARLTDLEDVSLLNDWKAMELPGLWEKTALPDFDGVVWLTRTIDVPADMAGKEAVLSLANVDDQDWTFVNGTQVGHTSVYNVQRSYTVPAGILKEGANTIAVRVLDTGGGGGVWGLPGDMYLAVGDHKIFLNGTWDYAVAQDIAKLPPQPKQPIHSKYPTVLYNGMMHPLTVMPVKGVLWYQGCSNVGRAEQYSRLFKRMITDWRKEWNNPDMPFYFVQLASYLQPKRLQPNSEWAALRQAQADALELDNVRMVVATDLGDPDDIHPKNKQEVAHRLLLHALGNQYRKRVLCESPKVEQASVNGRHITVKFDRDVVLLGGGKGFIVRDADNHWALAYGRQLGDDTIEVVSDDIEAPVELRFNWADYPEGDMHGTSGLPVAPFAVTLSQP